MGKIDFGAAFSEGWNGFSKNILNFIVGYLLVVIISITVILAPVMIAGIYRMGLKAARGETTEINDVFSGFSDFGRYFVGGLLWFGVMLLGVLACGVGVFVTSGITLFLFPLMVDRGESGGSAFSQCWAYFKTDWLMAIVLAFVTGLISSLGSYVAGIGVLVTGPFAMMVTVAAYEQVFGGTAPATAPTAQPV
ncbi:MAG: hypothetical protein M5R36_27780 [Deltaproteobacteria bacterium]|nr:hypothetical protein [Deltaproteobacteria bacterium]